MDSSMCHVWPDIVVRGVGGTAVLRTRQLVKDARPVSVLAYNGGRRDVWYARGSTFCPNYSRVRQITDSYLMI